MRTVTAASVRVYARRYVAAFVAVVAGVSFVIVTATLTSATKAGMLSGLESSYPGADVVVRSVTPAAVDRTLQRLDRVGSASVAGDAYVPVAVNGTTRSDDSSVGTVSTTPSLRWQHLAGGRWPRAPGEALVDSSSARNNGVHLGDRLRLGEGSDVADVRVVGFARRGSGPLSAPTYVTWPDLKRLGDQVLPVDLVVAGASLDDVRSAGLPQGVQAVTVQDFVQEQAKSLTRNVDVVATMVLLFAAIALFVSVLVIANTFTVLLAQRQRDFALLRCIGASKRQVMRSVRQEALAIGVVAATAGVLVGLGLGRLLVLVIARLFSGIPVGEVHVGWLWLLVAWVIGVLVTTAASVLPARRTTRIQPLAALRPMEDVEARSRSGVLRLVLGVVLVAAGVVLLALAMATSQPLVMVLGGFASFVGLLVFGPWLVPACIRVVGLVTGRLLGVPGRLATQNAVRNPRRTAATAASLLVGTTLVTGMVVGMATIRGAVDRAMDQDHPLDLSLTSTRTIGPGVSRSIAAVPGVDRAVALPGLTATLRAPGAPSDPVTVVAPVNAAGLAHGSVLEHPPAGTAYVPWNVMNQLTDQSSLTLMAAGHEVDVRPVGRNGIDDVVVAPGTLDLLGGATGARAVWASAEPGADADQVTAAVSSLARSAGADATGSLQQRHYVDLQLDVMVYAVLALLSVALLIALLGIANTLGLSVVERRREHAMLRALGLTRGQLRATMAVEAVLLAAVTSVIGVVVGSAYALVGVRTLLARALGGEAIHLTLPVGQLTLVVVVAALAGLAACVLPARRAARIAPAAGLAAE